MPGKLVEINPNISVRADTIQAVTVNTDRSGLTVRTDHEGVLNVVPLAGESIEDARRRILASINRHEESCGMQLIEVDKGYWVDPADVTQVVRSGGRHAEVTLVMRNGLPAIELGYRSDGEFVAGVAAKVNAVMRERHCGFPAV